MEICVCPVCRQVDWTGLDGDEKLGRWWVCRSWAVWFLVFLFLHFDFLTFYIFTFTLCHVGTPFLFPTILHSNEQVFKKEKKKESKKERTE